MNRADAARGTSMSISILILTLNEETNIGACLDSLVGFDDIVVFDSVSKDKTVEIAVAKGARIVERPFDNWAAHQNWAIVTVQPKHLMGHRPPLLLGALSQLERESDRAAPAVGGNSNHRQPIDPPQLVDRLPGRARAA